MFGGSFICLCKLTYRFLGGDIIEGLVMESADLLVEYAKKALKRF